MTAAIVQEVTPAVLPAMAQPTSWPVLGAELVARHAPDTSLVVAGDATLRARCSLWWTNVPPRDGERLGVIGHFAATDEDAAGALLEAACRALTTHGCSLAVGPMDGNTWRSYRFVVERGTEPPYFLEPGNPPEWPLWWLGSGFAPLAYYTSALNADLTRRDERAEAVAVRLTEGGVRIRSLDPADFTGELRRIHAVAAVSFRDNFLYTPIPEAEFVAQYTQVQPLVRPELVFIAEQGERPVGFAFSIPDVNEARRGERVRTVIIKTIAILPERKRLGGLGSLLADRTQAVAHTLGFERAIHALMHEANASRGISGRTGSTMRRYALLARPLTAGAG